MKNEVEQNEFLHLGADIYVYRSLGSSGGSPGNQKGHKNVSGNETWQWRNIHQNLYNLALFWNRIFPWEIAEQLYQQWGPVKSLNH